MREMDSFADGKWGLTVRFEQEQSLTFKSKLAKSKNKEIQVQNKEKKEFSWHTWSIYVFA